MNTLTLRQAGFISVIALFSSKFLILPSLLYEENRFGAIFSLFLVLIIEISLLYFLITLKRKQPEVSFYEIFKAKLGTVLTKIITAILLIFFCFKFFYILQESFSFLKQTLYTEATTLIYLVCVLPIVNALVYKGLKPLGRTLEIFYIIIIVCLVFSTISWFLTVKELHFTVFESNGIQGLLSAAFKYSFWFCDFVVLIPLLDKIVFRKDRIASFFSPIILGVVILVMFCFAYLVAYQTTSFIKNNAIFDISQFSNYFGTIGKFGIISITGIAIMLFFELAIFLAAAVECLKKIATFTHKAQPLIFINTFLLFATLFVFLNSNNTVIFFSQSVLFLAVIVGYIIFPLFILLYKLYKRRRQ